MPASHPDTAKRLLAAGVSTLGNAGAKCASPRLRSISGLAVAGRAMPLRCAPGDNLALHVAVTQAEPLSILVADASQMPEFGYWGEVLTVAAQQAQIAGLIIDGSVRDIDQLLALEFPVFGTGVAARGASKDSGGEVGFPTTVGGVTVQMGDWIVGDADGVVVITQLELESVLNGAEERVRWEERALGEIQTGRSTVALFDLDISTVRMPSVRR